MSEKDKEERIYHSWKVLFWKFGIKKVSVDMIVWLAWIGKGTFYLYFKNKIELYEKIVDDILFAGSNCMQLKADKFPDIKQRLVHEFLATILFFEKNDIIRNLAHGDRDYFTWKIDHLFIKQAHLSLLKDLLKDNYDDNKENLLLLSRLIGFYTHISHMKWCFPSEEEYVKFSIEFASIVVNWFFSDFNILSEKIKYDTIKSEIDAFKY